MANIFISYHREDDEIAAKLSNSLEKLGLSVLRDMDTLVSGEEFSRVIADSISNADAVIVLLSHHSKRSGWVEKELQAALTQEKVIIPILLDEDAKNNWIWPLVSDRVAVNIDDNTNYDDLAIRVEGVITHGNATTDREQKSSNTYIKGSSNINVANVSVNSRISNVQQSTLTKSRLDSSNRDHLQVLLGELEDVLLSVPPENQNDAERVAMAVEMFTTEGFRQNPNTAFLQIAGKGLIEAAEILKDSESDVQKIAEGIVNCMID